ncbi:MAG: sulfite exporter TauE/SafE family protein [Nitrosomonadales bacterium]|nr:sulfite exporter TauE/SafE family protein [Nitrosomonadales bacterium]
MDYLTYLLAGAIAGLLSGLFGVGGGLIIVPILSLVFTGLAFPEQHVMHMALGTSLATILFTSVSSARAHHSHANIIWSLVSKITPGIVLGALLGTVLAASLETGWLRMIFALFVFAIATQLILNLTPNPKRGLPGLFGTSVAGVIIGIISSLVGIGGGSLSVPFLIYCNISIKKSIGTSAAIGLPIALAGTAGFIFNGLHATQLPSYSIGYIFIPAVFCIASVSWIFAPLGAKLAQHLPAMTLKRAFAVLLYLIGLKMLWGLL